jgi:hypothetical protein
MSARCGWYSNCPRCAVVARYQRGVRLVAVLGRGGQLQCQAGESRAGRGQAFGSQRCSGGPCIALLFEVNPHDPPPDGGAAGLLEPGVHRCTGDRDRRRDSGRWPSGGDELGPKETSVARRGAESRTAGLNRRGRPRRPDSSLIRTPPTRASGCPCVCAAIFLTLRFRVGTPSAYEDPSAYEEEHNEPLTTGKIPAWPIRRMRRCSPTTSPRGAILPPVRRAHTPAPPLWLSHSRA